MDYKLTQSQYARIYGVTERSIRTYQKRELPLDEPGKTSAFLSLQKTPPPGLNPPPQAKLNYSRESGIALEPTPERTDQLEELIWKFWEANNEITMYVRHHNWPQAEQIVGAGSEVSIIVQRMRKLAGIVDHPVAPEDEDED